MNTFFVFVALLCSLTAVEPAYWEHNGLVVIEVESAAPSGAWSVDTALTGFTGVAYYTWGGPNTFSSPGNGVLSYRVIISEPGIYQLRIHNRHDHADSTLENDCFTRIDGGEWVKTFSSIRGQWTWHSRHEFSNGNKPDASYDLSAGEHLFEINGRSTGFSIDRIHLFKAGAAGADQVTQAETKAAPMLPPLQSMVSIARHAAGGNWGKALAQAERDAGQTKRDSDEVATAAAVVNALHTFANEQHERIVKLKKMAPATAVTALAELAVSYSGHDLGKSFVEEAKSWAKEPAVRQAIAADRIYAAMKEASEHLDTRGNVNDEAWCKRNRPSLQVIIGGWRELQATYPDTPAAGTADHLVTALGLQTLANPSK
jgi:hypothetical protein